MGAEMCIRDRSHKSAKLDLILHDRSRLSEVAPFVKPDLFGSTQIHIEYGWSHPDGGPASNNSFGKFLNSLRCQEKYQVVNTQFSFTENGEVEINIDLSMLGAPMLDTVKISAGEVDNAVELLQSLTRAVSIARRKISKGTKGSGDVTSPAFLSLSLIHI